MSTPSKPNTFVAAIDVKLAGKLRSDLVDQNFEIAKPPYTIFSAKKRGISCTLYETGKLVVQGREKEEFIEFYLEPNILRSFAYSHAASTVDTSDRIGIDESGKGDVFGPLCIAGVYASGNGVLRLQEIGVRDSKSMSDKSILILAEKIRSEFPHHVVKIFPEKYNQLYKRFANLNSLLGWGHAAAIEALFEKTSCRNVIIDQFASEHVVIDALKKKEILLNLTQRHRGEEDLVVAAASILAREAFLSGLERLGKEWALELPKGASALTISAGRQFVRSHGKDFLHKVAKMHFKSLDAILQ